MIWGAHGSPGPPVWVVLLATIIACPTLAQSPLDTVFPSPRINGTRLYGLGVPGHIDVDPDLVHFDDTTRTATVTFHNPTAIADTLWLAPECGGDGKPQPDDPLAAAWQNQYACAAPWVSGYPQYLVLAPHSRRTLTLELHPFPTLPDGRYIARVMINGIDHNMGHDETAIEYIKGPKYPRPSRTRWVAAAPAASAVQADHAVLVLDDHTHTAAVTLTNPGATATELWFTMDCPWFQIHYETVPGYTHKSQYELTWHLLVPNMVTWLSGYPQHLVLAPHERRTVTVSLMPFVNGTQYPTGSYYAQLRYVQSPQWHVTAVGDTIFTTPTGTVDVVYHRGTNGAPPRLVLDALQYTSHSDGTATVCVPARQPGLGMVATLEATVTPVSDSRMGATPAWRLDTTVVVWNVIHHHHLNRTDEGRLVPPDPVCFVLPDLDAGHYQLAVSVQPLGGDVQSVVHPLEVP